MLFRSLILQIVGELQFLFVTFLVLSVLLLVIFFRMLQFYKVRPTQCLTHSNLISVSRTPPPHSPTKLPQQKQERLHLKLSLGFIIKVLFKKYNNKSVSAVYLTIYICIYIYIFSLFFS